MATYAIGDIQGCYDSLQALLATIGYQKAVDELWLVGDLVNRGPKSLEVLRWARSQEHSVVAVLGNHDLHLLANVAGYRSTKRRDTLEAIKQAPDLGELIDWLRTRPLLVRRDGHVLVHAGIFPAWDIAAASRLADELCTQLSEDDWRENLRHLVPSPRLSWAQAEHTEARLPVALAALTRLRMLRPNGALSGFTGHPKEATDALVPWFDHPTVRDLGERFVFGHWAALGLRIEPHAVCLDTGCIWGRHLTAMRIDDGEIFQQASLEA